MASTVWQVERSYRVYHKEACATSLIHPQAVQAQNIKYANQHTPSLSLTNLTGTSEAMGRQAHAV